MSEVYSDVEISIAFNEGYNDAWSNTPPRQLPANVISNALTLSYRKGHVAGTTARYYYDAGYKAAKEAHNE